MDEKNFSSRQAGSDAALAASAPAQQQAERIMPDVRLTPQLAPLNAARTAPAHRRCLGCLQSKIGRQKSIFVRKSGLPSTRPHLILPHQ